MLPPEQAIYALQSPVDQAITRLKSGVGGKQGEQLEKYIGTELGFIRIVGTLQDELSKYKKDARKMTEQQLLDEEHESERLGRFMRAMGIPKPGPRWEAHAIVAGAHNQAAVLRAVLALAQMRIDDPDNGAWLPKTKDDARGTVFPNAVPHRRIHRWHYYRWLEEIITFGMSEPELRTALRAIRQKLQTSSFPPKVMKRKGED